MVYLAIAYTLIAIVLIGYGWSLYHRASKIDAELAAFENRS